MISRAVPHLHSPSLAAGIPNEKSVVAEGGTYARVRRQSGESKSTLQPWSSQNEEFARAEHRTKAHEVYASGKFP